MSIRNGRTGSLVALGALVMFTSSAVLAGQFGGSEDHLLGVALRTSTYRDVMKKYGQPDEVQAGGPFLPVPPKDVAAAAGGAGGGFAGGRGGSPYAGGGAPSAPGSGGGGARAGGPGGGSGKRATSKNGFPGKSDGGGGGGTGGPAVGGGSPGSGGYPGGAGGYPASPGSSGSPGGSPGSSGYPGGASSGGKGLPGFNGPGGEGGPGGPGLPGAGGEGSGGSDQGDGPATETTWWYHNKAKGYHMSFLFNKKGQVIQIQEYGVSSLHGSKTRQGIMLGSNMTQVLGRYGWSNDGAHDGENVIMRYGESDKVAFQMVKNKVLGITVAVGH